MKRETTKWARQRSTGTSPVVAGSGERLDGASGQSALHGDKPCGGVFSLRRKCCDMSDLR
jgi:hypothetical protein